MKKVPKRTEGSQVKKTWESSVFIEDIFKAVVDYIREQEGADMQHVYIDGSKFEANANKYTFVWKKGTEKSRYRLFEKITTQLEKMHDELSCLGLRIETNTEYTPEQLEEIAAGCAQATGLDVSNLTHGRGHHKCPERRIVFHNRRTVG